jgi:pyrimidine operon attenuation protein/uracil phosphoribosyltransferase
MDTGKISQDQLLYSHPQVDGLVRSLAEVIHKKHPNTKELVLVGIRTGGAYLAFRLQKLLGELSGAEPHTGVIDITLYRDDWTRLHTRPVVGRTEINFSIEDRVVVLVDDVLFTGRTTRAALDALIDFGRPARIELAVLIDRGHRELPLQPDYVGAALKTGQTEVIDVFLVEEGVKEDSIVKRLPLDSGNSGS